MRNGLDSRNSSEGSGRWRRGVCTLQQALLLSPSQVGTYRQLGLKASPSYHSRLGGRRNEGELRNLWPTGGYELTVQLFEVFTHVCNAFVRTKCTRLSSFWFNTKAAFRRRTILLYSPLTFDFTSHLKI